MLFSGFVLFFLPESTVLGGRPHVSFGLLGLGKTCSVAFISMLLMSVLKSAKHRAFRSQIPTEASS